MTEASSMSLQQNDGKALKEYDPKTAFQMAMRTGNVIGFDDAKQADWFSRRYKAAWGKP